MDKNLFAVREGFVFFIIYLEFTRLPHVCVCCIKCGKAHLKYFHYQCYAWNNLAYVFLLSNQPDALIIQILVCYKTLHVSGIFSAHHQEFSTAHSALISFMQVYDERFEAESGCSILTLLESGFPGREAEYSRPASVELKNTWSDGAVLN
jgi:hypothetical protein